MSSLSSSEEMAPPSGPLSGGEARLGFFSWVCSRLLLSCSLASGREGLCAVWLMGGQEQSQPSMHARRRCWGPWLTSPSARTQRLPGLPSQEPGGPAWALRCFLLPSGSLVHRELQETSRGRCPPHPPPRPATRIRPRSVQHSTRIRPRSVQYSTRIRPRSGRRPGKAELKRLPSSQQHHCPPPSGTGRGRRSQGTALGSPRGRDTCRFLSEHK